MSQSMTHSDEYKPMGMSSTKNITYINVDHAAIGRVDIHETGSSRMFNWIGARRGVGGRGRGCGHRQHVYG